MKYVSLFSGVGGADIGFDRAGMECLAQVEWDKYCQQVLRYRWPDVPKYGDIREVNGDMLGEPDVVIFGSPCQDLSTQGKRNGFDGSKSSLFFEAMRIIKEIRVHTGNTFPKWAVWENVTGAFSSNGGNDFAAVLDALGEAGALVIEWAELDAADFGLPQRRRRVFVAACFDPDIAARCPDEIFAFTQSSRGNHGSGETLKGNSTRQVPDSSTEHPVTFYSTHGLHDIFGFGKALTLKTSGPLCVLTPEGVIRKLTPVEHERLMGWPDNHTAHGVDGPISDTQRYKQCGNGIASPVAEWVALQLIRATKGTTNE